MLRNYDEWSREYEEKWHQSITQDLSVLEEPARSIFLSKSGRSYDEWKKYKGERHDLIAVLWAIVNDPRGWDLNVIEEIVASRRERQRQRYQQIHGIPQDTPRMGQAIQAAVAELGRPGRAGGCTWDQFNAKVWNACGVKPEAYRYSSRTIRRAANKLANVQLGLSE